jgi:hypothetical protein
VYEDTVRHAFSKQSVSRSIPFWHFSLLSLLLVGGLLISLPGEAAPKLPRLPLPNLFKTGKPDKPRQAKPEEPEKPETSFIQVHPDVKDPAKFVRSKGQKRAVVLMHGYWLCFNKDRVPRAVFKDWQRKGSPLVTTLGPVADVFAFAYGQTVSVEEVAHLPALRAGIARLKMLGYSRIVLVGHSAGGLVARYFVEDFPDAGITKVVQVCAPNGGTRYADIKLIPNNQKLFVASLSTANREKCLEGRQTKKIPTQVQFICLLGMDDLIVPCRCQWTQDLQKQGVPAVKCVTNHHHVMRRAVSAKIIAQVIRDKYPRWTPVQVADAVKELFTKKTKLKKAMP